MQIRYKELSKQLNNEPNQPFYIPTQATTTRLGQQFRTVCRDHLEFHKVSTVSTFDRNQELPLKLHESYKLSCPKTYLRQRGPNVE